MLVIRADQMRILTRHSLVNTMLVHAREAAPEVCASITTGHLRSIVDYCLERCTHYGITRNYDILRYLNLMLVFGCTFDVDEPWAAGPLKFRNPNGILDLLMDHALKQKRSNAGGQRAS